MRRTGLKLALVAAGLLVGLAAAELVVRLSGAARPAELGALFDRPTVAYEAAPERRHPWSARRSQTHRVAVVGDSFTVGEGNQTDDAYPARLERLLNLNAAVTPVAVEVYAAKGIATEDQRGFVLRALRERADLVILGIVLNDTETGDDPTLTARRQDTLPRIPSGWTLRLARRSHAFRLAYHKKEQARAGRALLAYYRDNFDPDYIGWARFREALDYIAARCERRGVPLVAVVFPGMFRLESGDYPFRYAHERIGAALTEASIQHLDLLDHFLGKSELRLAAQPGLDGHPNEIAHRVAAEAIFDHLLATGVLDESYQPREQTPAPVENSLRAARRMLTPTALAD